MNLKQQIEEWEKTKKEISPWPWAEINAGDIVDSKEKQVILSFHHNESLQYRLGKNAEVNLSFIVSAPENYDAALQALKEAAEIMDKIGLEENEVNATLVKPTESDVELKILNAYLKDFWSAPRRWLKKWGFE